MKHIVLAPHLDDEVIGCYSVWDKITEVVYFTNDYRTESIKQALELQEYVGDKGVNLKWKLPPFIWHEDYDFTAITKEDIIYIPSKYDYHPLHKTVRNMALGLKGTKMFYSIEMNVPWLEQEADAKGKLDLLEYLYPKEDLFLKNAKYYLFCSIKPYDDIVMRKVSATSFYYQSLGKSEDERAETVIWNVNEEQHLTPLQRFHKIQNSLPNTIIKYNNGFTIIE